MRLFTPDWHFVCATSKPVGGRRVVITGIGVVSPIGIGASEFWSGALAGVCGVGPLTRFDPGPAPSRIAAEVKGFDVKAWMSPRRAVGLSRAAQFAVAAARMAVEDAHLDLGSEDEDRWVVVTGTSNADCEPISQASRSLFLEGMQAVNPALGPFSLQSSTASAISVVTKFRCELLTISTGCSSGAAAIGQAFRQIRSGDSDAAITGGTEAPLIPLVFCGLANGHALSERNDDPGRASRPFDRSRDGYVLGEGAAFFVLEEARRAFRRGARVYAEIAGFGATCDAFSIGRVYGGAENMARAMRRALEDARCAPDEIDYVSAHASSSPLLDRRETEALKSVLGERALRIPVSSIKSMIGQPIGAGGALQVAATALSLHHGAIHPTINYEEPDPECDLDCVPNFARDWEARTALVNSYGMGGMNASLVLYHGGPRTGAVFSLPGAAVGAGEGKG